MAWRGPRWALSAAVAGTVLALVLGVWADSDSARPRDTDATRVDSAGDGKKGDLLESIHRPVPVIGRGPRYRPGPAGKLVAAGRPVGRLHCTRARRPRYGTHLEIFGRGKDLVIPAGIGIAPPRVRDGAYVRAGRCWYPMRTLEPTGLIEIDDGVTATLGEFFDLWGQPLSRTRLVGFRARSGKLVSAYVNGRRWKGDPRLIPLRRHAAIVLEVSGYFPPTREYAFPPGL
jgi:hypothetical protein